MKHSFTKKSKSMTCKYDFGLFYRNSFIEKSSQKILALRSFYNLFSNFLWKYQEKLNDTAYVRTFWRYWGIFPILEKIFFSIFPRVKRISLLGNSHNFSAPTTTLPMHPLDHLWFMIYLISSILSVPMQWSQLSHHSEINEIHIIWLVHFFFIFISLYKSFLIANCHVVIINFKCTP